MRTDCGSWCKACGYTANQYKDCVRHVESRHLKLRIECNFCQSIVNTRFNFQRHMKSKHMSQLDPEDVTKNKLSMKNIMKYCNITQIE